MGDESSSFNLVPEEDTYIPEASNPIHDMISTCYGCGRRYGSDTYFIRIDSGDKWDLINTLGVTEKTLTVYEEAGLYTDNKLLSAGSVELLTTGYGINFRDKIWVYQLCPECQWLLNLPELSAKETKGLKNNKTEWAKVISWTEVDELKKAVEVQVTSMPFDLMHISDYMADQVRAKFIRKQFKDFSYITVEPTNGTLIWTFILTLVLSVGLAVYNVKNGIEAGD